MFDFMIATVTDFVFTEMQSFDSIWETMEKKVHNQQYSSSEEKHKELNGTFSTTPILGKKRKESFP